MKEFNRKERLQKIAVISLELSQIYVNQAIEMKAKGDPEYLQRVDLAKDLLHIGETIGHQVFSASSFID